MVGIEILSAACRHRGDAGCSLLAVRNRCVLPVICVLLLGWIWGCATFTRIPGERQFDSETTRNRFERLKTANGRLQSLRAIGNVVYRSPGQPPVNERVAFALVPPDRVRIAVRAMTGLPLVTLAADGDWVYLVDHRDRRYLKKPLRGNPLKSVLGIDIAPGDLVELLCGRLPDVDFDRAESENRSDGDGSQLVLENRWGRIRYRIDLEPETDGSMTGLARLGRDGDVRWRADLTDYRDVDAYRLPARIRLTGGNGTELFLEMDRAIADQPVDSRLFVLDSPFPDS